MSVSFFYFENSPSAVILPASDRKIKNRKDIKMADLVNAVLEFLKLNGTISDLEKDILDTADKLFKQPFSREDVQKKVGENYQKHYDIIFSAGLVLGGNFMSFQDLSDKELRANLCVQLIKLCEKENEELKKRIGQEWQNRLIRK